METYTHSITDLLLESSKLKKNWISWPKFDFESSVMEELMHHL